MALARNFEDVVFQSRVQSSTPGVREYEDTLSTGGRIIGFTVDEQVALGISFESDIVRLRVAGTRDVRELPDTVTNAIVGETTYSITRRVGDVKPGFIDFYLEA